MVGGLRRLRAQDYWLLTEATALLVFVRLGLSFSSLQVLQHRLLRANPPRRAPAQPARIAWMVRNAARPVPGASCLTQALAYQAMLHRRGVRSELKLGVKHDQQGKFAAHAWVSVGGQVLLGGSTQEVSAFAPIAEFGAGPR